MLNVNKLKSEIVRNGLTQAEFCALIGMAHSTFIRKMKRKVINTDEAMKMIEVLKIENPNEIFLQKN